MTAPNILVIMADQLSGTLFPDGPAPFLHTPHLRALAQRSARFTQTYCASPLCAPSRAAIMSAQLPSRTGVYDNAAEFASAIPPSRITFAARATRPASRARCTSSAPTSFTVSKSRLTTDIYPADFGWTPDWRKPGERIDWWYHNLGSVTGAGTAEITNQLEYDDEVAYHANAKLRDLARGHDPRPWCLTVSFTHPHDPFVARKQYWDLYADCPETAAPAAIPYASQDPHSRRLLDSCDAAKFDITARDD